MTGISSLFIELMQVSDQEHIQFSGANQVEVLANL